MNQLVGESPQIVELRLRITRLVQSAARGARAPAILIQGETGTGKGLIAGLLHRMSARAKGPFVDVNCAAIPEPLLEAELFGYERGAFTDARRSKPGLFQTAHGGTLFLDEVGLLPLPLQAKLLTVLEERAVRRLGATQKERVDVWIVSASNADLDREMLARRFREDLYHRLAVVTLRMPALRERPDDIVPLAEHFLELTRADYGLPLLSLTADACERLRTYDWPGNVRELANVIERAVLLGNSPRISAAALGLSTRHPEPSAGAPTDMPRVSAISSRKDMMREHLRDVLRENGGNVSHAARTLGISRNTVRARMRRFGLGEDQAAGEENRPAAIDASARRGGAELPAPPLMARPAPSLPGSVRWERRRITLLRTFLPSPRGEQWASAGRGLQFVIDKVQGFGGSVRDLSPVSLDGIFGVDATEEAPRRAAHAALAVLKAFERGREQDRELSAPRIAIHSGRALVGYVGETAHVEQQSAQTLSATLNALMDATQPGEVLVSTSTAASLERRFALEPRQVVDPSAARAYRLSGYERGGLGLWGTPSQFVGRGQEVRLLRSHGSTVLGGQSRVIALVGGPGVGKSRLIWEFRREQNSLGWRVLEATCVDWGRTLYHLVAELLRAYFDIDPGMTSGPARARIETVLSSFGDSPAATLPALLAVLGLSPDSAWERLDPPEQRRRMIDAIRQLFVFESRRQPLLIIVEDAHWIDAESRAVLEALVSGLGAERILLLISYRPAFGHRWSSLAPYAELDVDPLPKESAIALLEGLLGQDEAFRALKEDLVTSTEGNPFFLEESVRALVDAGALTGERGDYRLARLVTRLEVPPTVEEVLATRIDRLSPDDRRLLQTAAIIGPHVSLPVLRALVNIDDEALNATLRRLQATDLLDEESGPGGGELSFKHALTHEVARLSVPPGLEQAINKQVLAVLEQPPLDTVGDNVDRLAYHARGGAVWDKALAYTREAGDRALRAAATLKAFECYEQALDVLRHVPPSPETRVEAIDLRLRLRDALWPLGRLPEILQRLSEAEKLATADHDARRLGWISCYLCQYHWVAGESERALQVGERALALAQGLHDPALEAETRFYMGITYHAIGHFRRATEVLAASLAVVDHSVGLPDERFPSRRFAHNGRAIVRGWLAWVLAELGRFDEGAAGGLEAIAIAEAIASPFALVAATTGLGILHIRREALHEALEYLERGLALCQAYSLNNWFPTVSSSLGHVYVGIGRVAEGVAMMERGMRAASRSGIMATNGLGMVHLAEGYLRAGRQAEAEETVRVALEACRAHRGRGTEAWALWLKGGVAASASHPELAEATCREALAVAEQLEMRPLVVRCHLSLARLGGDRMKDHLDRATTLAREIGMLLPRFGGNRPTP